MQILKWRLVDDTDISSNIIRFVEKGSVSHVEFISLDGLFAIGARLDGGVAKRPLNYKKFNIDLRYEAVLGDADYFNTLRFLNAQLGKPYDLYDIIGIGLNRDWRAPDSWICSELWAATLEVGNVIRKIAAPVGLITPQDALILSSAAFAEGAGGL